MTTRSPHPSRVGEQLGSLRLIRLVGEGGMGAVYEARHTVLGRRQAVKLLHPELASHPGMYARFRREAQIAASLESEHIEPVREFGNASDGTPYLVMDLLAGKDLAAILANEAPLRPSRAAKLILQACRGLKVAHEHTPGIIHRDLKPENLFVCPRRGGREWLKILDFGIAKFLEPNPLDRVTATGGVIGTPHYMSPEQAEGRSDIDQRTDIYALGAILYETLCGHQAHPGKCYNEIISHILLKRPVPLASLAYDLSPLMLEIVERAMTIDLSRRFQSITQFAEALTHFLAQEIERTPCGVTKQAPLRAVDPTSHPESARDFERDVPDKTAPTQPAFRTRASNRQGWGFLRSGGPAYRTLLIIALTLSTGLLAHFRPWTVKHPRPPASTFSATASSMESRMGRVETASSTPQTTRAPRPTSPDASVRSAATVPDHATSRPKIRSSPSTLRANRAPVHPSEIEYPLPSAPPIDKTVSAQ